MYCGEKALYWEQWDYIGCAHCEGDAERAERGVVEAYCPTCTLARNTLRGPYQHPMRRTAPPQDIWECGCGEVSGDWDTVYQHYADERVKWRRSLTGEHPDQLVEEWQ
jgi:hypothetical protein